MKQARESFNSTLKVKSINTTIKPHFVFNTLNTIAYYCRTNSNKARELILELSNYLRNGLDANKEIISLNDELENIKAYLNLEKARFEEKLNIVYDIENVEIDIPYFTLQPIVENAVKHGALSKREGGSVKITIKDNDYNIFICIEDDGKGMDLNTLDKLLKDSNNTLSNVNNRIKNFYGKPLKITSNDKGTKVELSINKDI